MEIIIESTQRFENSLAQLGQESKQSVIEKINDCTRQFPKNKMSVYHNLDQAKSFALPNNYQSSLYILYVSPNLRVILTIDEDPIFSQAIFTLFDVVSSKNVEKAHREIAADLYKDLTTANQEIAQVS
ncbi:MAG: hypothetical protein AAGA80_27270 [Cyanobacteria bacterium P01_F01_bin.143]